MSITDMKGEAKIRQKKDKLNPQIVYFLALEPIKTYTCVDFNLPLQNLAHWDRELNNFVLFGWDEG